jgi:poly(3-hydroxybutyrate) depolymerase
VQSAFAAMRGDIRRRTRTTTQMPRLIVFHGTGDPTVAPHNAAMLMAEAQESFPAAKSMSRSFKAGSRNVAHTELRGPDGAPQAESWMISGAGHYWSGGDPSGSYAKPEGPVASREMMRFFLGKPLQI